MSEADERPDTAEDRTEQADERTATRGGTLSSGSSRSILTSDDPRFVSGTLPYESDAREGRRERAAAGEDFALLMGQRSAGGGTSDTTGAHDDGLPSASSVVTPDPFGTSRRDLAQRLDRLEGKVDALLAALDLDVRDGGRDE